MRFIKMHGAGNDYIYLDCFQQPAPSQPRELSQSMSDRHCGVGGDGLILIEPSESVDARMRMFNADGSEAEMCGNGIRCVAKYLLDHGLVDGPRMTVDTLAGHIQVEVIESNGAESLVRVDMGPPELQASRIPTRLEGEPPTSVPLTVKDLPLRVTCISMGNPHCVGFVRNLTDQLVHEIGPAIEQHSAFPNRTNVEFVRVIDRSHVEARVWERGSGETLACGTGACAICVAGVLTGLTDRRIDVQLPGGTLAIEWLENSHVMMTGPAVHAFDGDWSETSATDSSSS